MENNTVAIMPVFSTIMKALADLRMPSGTQLVGCVLATAAVYLVTQQTLPAKFSVGLICGYGQLADGELLPQTEARCQKAVEIYLAGEVDTLIIACYVETAGVTMGSKMREYLVSSGVPSDKIIVDERGMNTAGEIDVLREHLKPDDKVVCISNFYHLPRIWFLFATRGYNVSLSGVLKATNLSDLFWEPLKILNALYRPKSWSKILQK
ncbi:MAG: YdcF family protein [Candidatus Vogelbacteria bacterium]|nr:YdcF family protein [Candidatus Vogelbacteria bacterium]